MPRYHKVMSWFWYKLWQTWHHLNDSCRNGKHKIYSLGCGASDGEYPYANWQCRLCDWLEDNVRYHDGFFR